MKRIQEWIDRMAERRVRQAAQLSSRRGALARKGELARGAQLLARGVVETRLVEQVADAVTELLFVHGVIPRALSAKAKACAAREQCVFTLPSEQPMAFAVSATSSSSQ